VPAELQGNAILVAAAVMYAIEFVTDKIPYVDDAWDAIHTAIRPALGSYVGLEYGALEGSDQVDEILSAAGAGTTALASHAIKAGIRLGINTSPEPVSNILVSLTEDGLVALVVRFAVENPLLAAGIAGVLLAIGIAIVIALATWIRRGLRRWLQSRSLEPPRPEPAEPRPRADGPAERK
jgi:Domain of unknown function (DUF4126)